MTARVATRQRALTIEFDEIREPGVYLTQRGEMFRVPAEFLARSEFPLVDWESTESRLVTRISDDPYLPISRCRELAAGLDLTVRF